MDQNAIGSHTSLHGNLTPLQSKIVARFHDGSKPTYKTVSEEYGVSVFRVWEALTNANALRHQAKRDQRRRDREAERAAIFEGMKNAIVTSDVLDYLSDVPSGAASLIVSSPPYGIGKEYGGGDPSADRHPLLYFQGWLAMFTSECARVIKDGGTVVLQVGTTKDDAGGRIPIDTFLFGYLREAGLTYQSRVCWPSDHGLTPKRRLAERYETALVFSKGEPTFNPDVARRPQKHPTKRAYKGPNAGELSGNENGAFPTDLFDDIKHLRANSGEKFENHPAQFPVALAMRFVLLYSNRGDLIVDPFAGTGSVAEACLRTGRNFSGADLYYAAQRDERLAAIQPDLGIDFTDTQSARNRAIWNAEVRRRDVTVPLFTDEQEMKNIDDAFGGAAGTDAA